MSPDQFQDIHYHKDADGVVTLTLSTPKRKNALSMLSFLEIYYAIDEYEKDNSAYAMIITGAVDPDSTDESKEAYSSGGYFNPDALAGVSEEILKQIDTSDIAQKRTTLKMFECPKPIIAAVNGFAIGGAFTMTFAGADQIYVSEHAWVRLPFAKLGIAAELASSLLMPRLMGLHQAKEIMFFAEPINAEKLVELKLANKVLPHADLLTYAKDQARKLCPPQGAALAISEIKKLINGPLVAAVSEALDRENVALHKLFVSNDFIEGTTARVERREAKFTGT
ncbi:MAG: enoyl-CoA hydratase/carnithine racemase [Arenicella sp.]|jgi:enoyl-CoA hydratase/carnithine racemase